MVTQLHNLCVIHGIGWTSLVGAVWWEAENGGRRGSCCGEGCRMGAVEYAVA